MARKIFFGLVVFSIVIFSCTNGKKTKPTSVEFNPTEQESQLFYINPKQDTILTLKSGNKITVSENSFITTNKAKQTDSIYIEVFEYYNAEDLVLEGITNQSDSNLLKNHYYFYIKAYNNVGGLTINKNLKVKIGTIRNYNPQFYRGDKKSNGSFTWEKESIKIDSIYLIMSRTSILDTLNIYSDGSSEYNQNNDLYYLLKITKPGLYLLCEEIELENKSNVTVKVDIPKEYRNYSASCYLKNQNVNIGFSLEDKRNEFIFKIPEGEPFVLVCLHKEKNKVSYYMQEYTTDTKEIHVSSFTESSKADFKKKFRALIK